MIFNKKLDKSLWCILEADEKLRKDILNFLFEIPDNLLEELREIIELEDDVFDKEVISEDGSIFTYECSNDMEEQIIEINHTLAKPNNINDAYISFGSSLTLVNSKMMDDLNDDFWLGNFCYNSDFSKHFKDLSFVKNKCMTVLDLDNPNNLSYNREQEVEYYLLFQNNTYYIEKHCCYNGTKINLPINLNEYPEDLTIDYLKMKYGEDYPKRTLRFPNK